MLQNLVPHNFKRALDLQVIMELKGKNILLGVTGGIAAYRSAELVRLLRQFEAEVRVVMTPNATQFISALTMQALSGYPVRIELFDDAAEAGMSHIELARWADTVLIAPASASFLARIAHGIADDLLSTLCLATSAKLVVAPAMNRLMWSNAATENNMNILKSRDVSVLGPGTGSQACGEVGPGRLLEPEEIVKSVISMLSNRSLLNEVNVLVTAGSTWEALDPVRGISNLSSGKMGYAVANAATRAGARVTLVSGPVTTSNHVAVNQMIHVKSARDMFDAVMRNLEETNIFVSVAAVADYRPLKMMPSKIKKKHDNLLLELVKNPDILSEVKSRYPSVFAVGFAAETENLIEEGRRKLTRKGIDLIAANLVAGNSGALGSDHNTLELINYEDVITLGPGLKTEVAEQLIEQISIQYHAGRTI